MTYEHRQGISFGDVRLTDGGLAALLQPQRYAALRHIRPFCGWHIGSESLNPYLRGCADEGCPGKGCCGHVGYRRNRNVGKKDVQSPAVPCVLAIAYVVKHPGIGV